MSSSPAARTRSTAACSAVNTSPAPGVHTLVGEAPKEVSAARSVVAAAASERKTDATYEGGEDAWRRHSAALSKAAFDVHVGVAAGLCEERPEFQKQNGHSWAPTSSMAVCQRAIADVARRRSSSSVPPMLSHPWPNWTSCRAKSSSTSASCGSSW